MILVHLPLAPPLNGLTRNVPGKGRVNTGRYRTWRQAAGWGVQAAHLSPVHGPLIVEIAIPINAPADTDAYMKATLDLFVRHDLIDDDRRVMDLRVRRDGSLERKQMMVRITHADLATPRLEVAA